VLWHLDVEGRKPHELAEVLELSPNGVSALVYRARSALREAYLHQHIRTDIVPGAPACGWTQDRLAALVRSTLSDRDQERVHAHLVTCDACMAVHLELREAGIGLRGAPPAG
jgi:hypothetical protein